LLWIPQVQRTAVSSPITDPEVALLAALASTLEADYVTPTVEDQWQSSPFGWIRARPSRQKGKIGEQLIAGWCAAKGLNVTRSGDAQADRVIEGRRVEIKFSTLWESGAYTFQQIRNQDYSHLICLGLSPFHAQCWVLPKEVALRRATGQHMGSAARDTAWLSFQAASPPSWLGRYGGTLGLAYSILEKWKGGSPQ